METLTFRLAAEKDLDLFDDIRSEKLHRLHLSRIKKQKQKNAEYFIVFQDGKPAGHVFINYKNSGYDYPVLEDLFVKQESREQGLAKAVLLFAENHIKHKGFHEIGIDVEVGREWLRKFYEKMGYVFFSGPNTSTFDFEGEQVTQEVYHLRKTI